ncbi:MAG: hypothetical protein JW727_05050 [Candidatus Aenigmarchaeota archaeon]|nr:hypothetical protein [Candidatus Aenigmarchaeota archaeon]
MEEKPSEDIKKLVVARLQRMPPNYKLAIGGGKIYTREDIIACVNKDTVFGKRIVKMQLDYLRSFKRKVEAHE